MSPRTQTPPHLPRQRSGHGRSAAYRNPPVEPLDLGLLARLPSLPLRARYLVEGFTSGRHRSPLTGHSLEFTEYRAYQRGDEPRTIDWRLYGRSNRLNVKVYEDETRLNVCLLLDTSASLGYRSRSDTLSKLDYARTCLAALGLLVTRQSDAVGLGLAGSELERFLPPSGRKSQVHTIIRQLDAVRAVGPGALSKTLPGLAKVLKQRSLIIIASDFYEESEDLERALRHLRFSGHDVIGLQVLDPAEIDFDLQDAALYRDNETGALLPLSPDEVRDAYLARFAEFLTQLRGCFASVGADLVTLRTDTSPMEALSLYLARRRQRI